MKDGLIIYRDRVDVEIVDQVLIEVMDRARELFTRERKVLNRTNDVTARADVFRIIRAAVELSPTLPGT